MLYMSTITGFVSGLIVVLYRIGIEYVERLRETKYAELLSKNTLYGLLLMVGVSFIIALFLKKEPLISGSGIPQIRALLLRQINHNWLKVLVFKFFGGVLSIFLGFSLGREGPSIQLGAAAGQGVSALFKKTKVEERYLVTAGASAGLAAAFNAPLAGILFSLEELHKNFSPIVLLSSAVAAILADVTSKYFFGLNPVFDFRNVVIYPLGKYHYLIIFGLVLGILGYVFNYSLLKSLEFYSKLRKIPTMFRILIPAILSAVCLFTIPEVLGGGHHLVVSSFNSKYILNFLIILAVGKFILTMVSYGSGAPGGIFLPMLSMGALIGAIYGQACVQVFNIDNSLYKNFVIFGMAGYFTAVVRAPITGSILITEMTGSLSNLLPLVTVSMVSYVVAEALGSQPIYESLLDRLLSRQSPDRTRQAIASHKKTIIEVYVSTGSYLDGKKIKEVKWPENSLIVGVRIGDREYIPRGDTVLYAGTHILVLTDEEHAAEIKRKLIELASCSAENEG